MGSVDGPDFAAVFDTMPGVNLLLDTDSPRFTMLAASDERLAATLTTREETLGRPLFEVFSDANPENGRPTGEVNLRASLETVLRTRAPHRMPVQRYDIRRPDDSWEVRYWAPHNLPVLGPDGTVRYLLHHVEDVTEAVRRAEAHEQLRGEYAVSEDGCVITRPMPSSTIVSTCRPSGVLSGRPSTGSMLWHEWRRSLSP